MSHTKKSGNLFNDPRLNKCRYIKKSGNLFNEPHTKKFNDPRINLPYKKHLETYLMICVIKVPIQKSLETYLMILVSKCPYEKIWKLIS